MGIRGNNHQIDNIEFNVADIARSKAFYGAAFGWTFTDYGPSYTEFSDGRLTGGFTTGEEVRPGGPLVILYADDLAEAQRRVEAAGAVISRAVFAFPGAQVPLHRSGWLRAGRVVGRCLKDDSPHLRAVFMGTGRGVNRRWSPAACPCTSRCACP